jgi:hypothetical protein
VLVWSYEAAKNLHENSRAGDDAKSIYKKAFLLTKINIDLTYDIYCSKLNYNIILYAFIWHENEENRHQVQVLKKGGSWADAIRTALERFKKRSNERKRRRKSWPVGREKRNSQ